MTAPYGRSMRLLATILGLLALAVLVLPVHP
jgi:hypothetical protein